MDTSFFRWVDDMERKAMDSFKQHSNVHVSVGVLSTEDLEVRCVDR